MKSELKKPNEIIMTRTPLKMSFFGGGTDLPDFSQKYGGCVVATAIDRYLYVVIREREDSTITLDTPFGHETCSAADQLKHPLVRAILENVTPLFPTAGGRRESQCGSSPRLRGDRGVSIGNGVSIWITTDMPAHGCGLGTSSALMVGLLSGLMSRKDIHESRESNELKKGKKMSCDSRRWADISSIRGQWEVAQRVAAIQLHIGGSGVQDAYVCALGGTRYFEFNQDNSVTAKALPDMDSSRLMLFDTGFARDSRDVQSEKKSAKQLMQIKQLAQAFVHIDNPQGAFPAFLRKTWELKRLVSSSISNERLDEIYNEAIASGATAGKLLGAGNGGHFVFYVEPNHQGEVRERLSDMGLKEVPFNFDEKGVQICQLPNSF